MEYIDIKKLIDVIRKETKKHANTKERVSKVLDELLDFTKNNYQLVGNYVLQEDLNNYLNSKLNVDGSNIENLEEWKIILNYYDKTETYSKEEIDALLNVIEVTKSELDILIENSQLKVNSVYKITEIESWYEYYEPTDTVYLTAISNNQLSTKGYGEFYVPKYNMTDVFQGIWKGKFLENGIDKDGNLIPESQPDGGQPLEPIYNIGDKVIWGGLVWRNISGDLGNNKYLWYNQDEETEYVFDLHNYLNPEDWELVPVNDIDYIIERCNIEYDYINDTIIYRENKFGNILKISNYNIYNSLQYNFQFSTSEELISFANIIKSFQWGIEYIENGCKNNLMLDSIVENCNLVGVFRDNIILNNSSFIQNQFFSISFYENRIENSSAFSYNTINFSHIKNNTILNNSYVNNNVFKYFNTFSNNVINKDSYFRNNIFYPYKGIISNTIERHSGIRDNVIKFDEMSYNTVITSSSISDNKYYLSIKSNILENSSSINNNDDGNISVNSLTGYIRENTLKNFSKIEYNTFVEEGKTVDGTIKSIYGNKLINNCSINNNTIKNGSRIFGHTLEYYSTINGNTLDTEANIYNNQLVQNGKIDNNILTGHGRIYGNQLDRQSEITNCKLRISPATSYSSGIHTNKLFTGKIQNIDFGNIVNPEGTNPNDHNFGGNALSGCIIENNSIIKDLTFHDIGNKYIQFVKMNGFSEFKNITINDSIRNVDFINTIFNETSDYSKLIDGSGYQTDGFTKTYIDGKLLTLSKLDDTYIPLTGTEEGKPIIGGIELMELNNNFWIKGANYPDNYFSLSFTEGGISLVHTDVVSGEIKSFSINSDGMGIGSYDFSSVQPENKFIYAQRQYVDNVAETKQDVLNETNLGEIIDTQLSIKMTPSNNDEIVMLDSITGEAVTAKYSSFEKPLKVITITGNITLSDIHNNAILHIVNTCTITVPTGISTNFSCNCYVKGAFMATFVSGGVILNAPNGLYLKADKMAVLYSNDINNFNLLGELSTT
jgi:hypothetical protein